MSAVLNPATVEQFVRNVDLILGDAEVEKAGGRVHVFLDTADVRDAVLGVQGFYADGKFDDDRFKQPRALVQALAASGYLGAFHLLEPHQAEFLALISLNFGLQHDISLPRLAHVFWENIGVLKPGEAQDRSLRRMSPEDINALVLEQVGSADRFFKAVEFIRGTWHTRLKGWRSKSILEIKRAPSLPTSLITSDLLLTLKKHFDTRRPERPSNNFADAVALLSLIGQVDDFRHGRSKDFPCFYAATSTFAEVVRHAGCFDRLSAPLASGRIAHALRGTDYFVLRAVFHGGDASEHKAFLPPETLQIIHKELKGLVASHPMSREDLSLIGFDESRLSNLVKDVRNLSFFENVWLPFHAAKETEVALQEMDEASFLIKDGKVEDALEKVVQDVYEDLRESAENFKALRTLWQEIPARFKRLSANYASHADTEPNLFRHTGLLRFSFPQPARNRIYEVIRALLGDATAEATATRDVVGAYWRTVRDNVKGYETEVAAAVLWTADLDHYTLRMLRNDAEPQHFSIDLVQISSAIRYGDDLPRALERLKVLEKQRRNTVPVRDRADLASGIAFVYYHLWNRSKSTPATRKIVKKNSRLSENDLIDNAVARAKEAYELLEKIDDFNLDPKRVYVLNQIVFCMCKSNRHRPEDIQEYEDKLLRWDGMGNVWQYRYDETLAQFYRLLAHSMRDLAVREDLLNTAVERATKARNKAPEDPEVNVSYENLKVELARLRDQISAQADGIR